MNEENNQKNIDEMDNRVKLEFEKSLELRNFEITNFWKRGWFFGALLLSIFTGYLKLKSMDCNNNNYIFYSACISFIAFLISLTQTLINRGSKYWQERWENKTKNRESKLKIDLTKTEMYDSEEGYYIDACILNKEENCLTVSRRISVSKLTFLAWDIITYSCLCIWINDIVSTFQKNFPFYTMEEKVIIFHFGLVVYIFCFLCGSKIGNCLAKNKEEFKKNKEKNRNKFTDDCEGYINDFKNNMND